MTGLQKTSAHCIFTDNHLCVFSDIDIKSYQVSSFHVYVWWGVLAPVRNWQARFTSGFSKVDFRNWHFSSFKYKNNNDKNLKFIDSVETNQIFSKFNFLSESMIIFILLNPVFSEVYFARSQLTSTYWIERQWKWKGVSELTEGW